MQPQVSYVTVELHAVSGAHVAYLRDILGRIVKTQSIAIGSIDLRLDLSEVAPGVYSLVIQGIVRSQ